MTYDTDLADRVRQRLARTAGVTELEMFGAPAFLESGHMMVGLHGGDLIVRVGTDHTDAALLRPGARPFDITGRQIDGWVLVHGAFLDDEALEGWLAQAAQVVGALPAR